MIKGLKTAQFHLKMDHHMAPKSAFLGAFALLWVELGRPMVYDFPIVLLASLRGALRNAINRI